jgi:membrane-bound metal-dependent hydrolase YbcI (DUF457 family)
VNRLGHEAAAQFAWLGFCATHDQPWQIVIAGAVVASSTCSGDWSPDSDQGAWVGKLIPGGHRGPTHMPELVALALWLFAYCAGPELDWFVMAVTAGWLSHLVADAAFGRIPLLVLGGRRVGLRFKTGGKVEDVLAWCLSVAALPLAWVALGGPIPEFG